MIDIRLPALGADMEQATLLEWRVQPGDRVEKGDILAVVDTTKAAIDVETWHAGTVSALLAEPGQRLPVGAPLATLSPVDGDTAGAAPAAPASAGAGQAPAVDSPARPAAGAEPEPAPRGAGKGRRRVSPSARKLAAEMGVDLDALGREGRTNIGPAAVRAAAARQGTPVAAAAGKAVTAGRPAVSPAARRRAAQLGVDPERLSGSGPGASVVRADVEQAAGAAPPDTPADAPAARAPAQRTAAMRRTIAAAMTRSWREIPHYHLSEDVPLERATRWLEAFNAGRPVAQRVLMVALYLKAVALAARHFPEFNGHYSERGFEASSVVHLGVAIALRGGGLAAPALHGCADQPVPALMTALNDLVRRTRAGRLRGSELRDPTLTVSNLGERGVRALHGLVHPPQVALVGFGRVSQRAWVRDGWLGAAPVVTLTLAADHRVSDGHRGGLFLADIHDRLQAPESLAQLPLQADRDLQAPEQTP